MLNLNKKYFIETYGCQMNVRESEIIAGILESIGYEEADAFSIADIIIFNTCCIRDHAEKKLLGNVGALKELKESNPGLIIGICGCMTQQKNVSNRLFSRFPFVDFIIGTKLLHQLPQIIEDAKNGQRTKMISGDDAIPCENLPSHRSGKHSTFINITYGCNNFCTYCIVPYVRGRESSRSPESILNEINSAVEEGYDEITLLGQNVNSYYWGESDTNFPKLLKEAERINGIKRIRFMTSHPKDLSDELIQVIADSDIICHHVHLPLQSGSDKILQMMNRKYNMERYYSIVDKMRNQIPDIEFTTDIIVGFPGETDDDFKKTLEAVNNIGFISAFTFKYSPRPGTIAAGMKEQIPEQIKKERLQILNELQNIKTNENNAKYIGYSSEIHVEGYIDGDKPTIFGKFGNFKMVYLDGSSEDVGKYKKVLVDSIHKNSLIGHEVD